MGLFGGLNGDGTEGEYEYCGIDPSYEEDRFDPHVSAASRASYRKMTIQRVSAQVFKLLSYGTKVEGDINNEIFDFGKHRGRTVKQVVESDPTYVCWLCRECKWWRDKRLTQEAINKLAAMA